MATKDTAAPDLSISPLASILTGEPFENFNGPFVNLFNYFDPQRFRHWTRASDPQGWFVELQREAIRCQYFLLHDIAREVYGRMSALFYPPNHQNNNSWGLLGKEGMDFAAACLRSNGEDPRKKDPPYGESYLRAKKHLTYEVRVPCVITEEAAEEHNRREREEESPRWTARLVKAGEIEIRSDLQQSLECTAEQLGRYWVNLFLSEVEAVINSTPPGSVHPLLHDLVDRLEMFKIGAHEGAPTLQRMNSESLGAETLAIFNRCRSRLIGELHSLLRKHPEMTEVSLPQSVEEASLEPIRWKGSVQVLAWLLRELAEKDWIDAPRHTSTTSRYDAGDINASAFTKALAPHFPVNATALGQELKAEGGTVPAQDVVDFNIPKRPN